MAPYNPMLNTLENLWSVIKAYIKRKVTENIGGILSAEIPSGTKKKKNFLLGKLEGIIETSFKETMPMLFNRVIAKSKRILPSVLNLNDVQS